LGPIHPFTVPLIQRKIMEHEAMLQEQLGTNDYQIIVRTEMGKVQDVNSTANIAHTFFLSGL